MSNLSDTSGIWTLRQEKRFSDLDSVEFSAKYTKDGSKTSDNLFFGEHLRLVHNMLKHKLHCENTASWNHLQGRFIS